MQSPTLKSKNITDEPVLVHPDFYQFQATSKLEKCAWLIKASSDPLALCVDT